MARMGMTLGCTTGSVHVSSDTDNHTSRDPVMWPITDSVGRQLTMDELRQTIKVPLNETEVHLIIKSWKTLRRKMTSIGVAVFLR